MRSKRGFRVALISAAVIATALPLSASAEIDPPTTGFEDSAGASWTTHENELEFLQAVDAGSDRVTIEVIGTTLQERPLHLVTIGDPVPRERDSARTVPTTLFVCTQHGNEPAGREACLMSLRDLAFTDDPTLVQQLQRQTMLFVPTANPDGRARNSRGNSQGVDINRDHLNLETLEAQAIAAVVREWQPDAVIDLHEYGPGTPVLYDDEMLYLWPRNLNVDPQIHDLARVLAEDHLAPCSEAAGYTADEYGLDKAGQVQVRQTAGDEDEGIARNAMGLRHALGILIETAVTPNATNTPLEVVSAAENQNRRVATHRRVIDCHLGFMRLRGDEARDANQAAALRKADEGHAQDAPVFWYGADNDPSAAEEQLFPPPCYYSLTSDQAIALGANLDLMGIRTDPGPDGIVRVPMGQAAEPFIPLLLDARARRHEVEAEAVAGEPYAPECAPG